jgi:hypothetical protein
VARAVAARRVPRRHRPVPAHHRGRAQAQGQRRRGTVRPSVCLSVCPSVRLPACLPASAAMLSVQASLEDAGHSLVPLLEGNLVDRVWGAARPAAPAAALRIHPLAFAGEGVADKLAGLRKDLSGARRGGGGSEPPASGGGTHAAGGEAPPAAACCMGAWFSNGDGECAAQQLGSRRAGAPACQTGSRSPVWTRSRNI